MSNADVLIIGSGIAALQLASHLGKNLNVRVLTKSKLTVSNSYLAQGGIAAAIGPADHPAKHYNDTLEAGSYHNNPEAVRQIIHEAPGLIQEIAEHGNVFDRDMTGSLLLGMEGAHCEHRIVHGGGDATGRRVSEYLINRLKSHVTVDEDVFVYQLLLNKQDNRCIGVKTKQPDGSIKTYYGNHIILATGGCGQLYSYTSNAKTVTGDGIALAYQAGAEITDMEFIQFHPTLLYVNGETKGLISEAVRGEGARLVSDDGTYIMEGVHPYKDLAPRYVVSQTIYDYLKKGHHVFLDITSISDFKTRFPSITVICEENGIDLADGKIPVVPGSHFLMGGIKTDVIGRTSIAGLYAIGEAACTGLHGANRLASNSLLEGLYQGKKLAEWLNAIPSVPTYEIAVQKQLLKREQIRLPEIQQIQESMMERVGIVRSKSVLKLQEKWLAQFKVEEINDYDSVSVSDLTKIFMLLTAQLITNAALQRTESRGGHYRSDYPHEDNRNWLRKSIIHKHKREVETTDEQIETAITTSTIFY
ncbi:L-aspartate oxidase [Bacillus sp. BRMEA1]|uniref:L-aspartate oxidase n=1 Tax=Neobacillus endophyticus TaxID=2738405 RepID=UPI00156344A6|nr:L-aspartate oxidase [Neobacillus endophyticus]NRD75976.1 L-aspartate oxidase [Neobacillus endophyticus]